LNVFPTLVPWSNQNKSCMRVIDNILYVYFQSCVVPSMFKKLFSHYSWVSLRHCAVNLTGGSTSNVLMLMLYWSEKMIRNSMYLPPNTRLINKTNNRLTLITVFCLELTPRHFCDVIWNSRIEVC
jgi:hypothetical protein